MAKYRKLPVVINAFQFGLTGQEIPEWFNIRIESKEVVIFNEEGYCLIDTLEGRMRAMKGDYIILGVKGEIYPCKADIFEKTYELA